MGHGDSRLHGSSRSSERWTSSLISLLVRSCPRRCRDRIGGKVARMGGVIRDRQQLPDGNQPELRQWFQKLASGSTCGPLSAYSGTGQG